eukprot:TRINITY_DN1509_c0_g2_i2.p1 TRINITY_DN1509_c0_g2~~TRINITY_DN1509_c0_g2_i2.p1  ORF type:complete len:508 (-),score=48.92 TRINITY_DN1509_c0_g2_i2:539-1990(-)
MVEGATIRCLADYESTSEGKAHGPIYGVVIDATRRYFKPHNSKYVASLKIIDYSWSKAKCPANVTPFVKVVFISSTKEDVPNIKAIGTIIKLNDLVLKRINDMKGTILMFTWDGALSQSKWELFPNAESPLLAERKQRNPKEEEYIETLYEFSRGYFAEQYFVDTNMNLSVAKSASEFEAVVRLTKAGIKLGENDQKVFDLKVIDYTGKAHVRIPYQTMVEEFPKLDNSCLLMIKGGRYKNVEDKTIELKEYGNLLIIPNNSMVATKFFELANLHIECSKTEDKVSKDNISKSFILSQITDPSLPITELHSVFTDSALRPRYHLRVYVLDIGPRDIHDWVKGYCSMCSKSFPLTGEDSDTKPRCILCDNEAEIIFQVQLFVKDYKGRDSNEIYKLLLYTHNGKGKGFFDQELATNLYRDRRLYKKLKGIYRVLTKYGVYLDCIVERFTGDTNSYLQIVDTVVGCDCAREITDSQTFDQLQYYY